MKEGEEAEDEGGLGKRMKEGGEGRMKEGEEGRMKEGGEGRMKESGKRG